MAIDEQAIWVTGFVVVAIIPVLVNLKIFLRSSDYDKDKLDLEKRLASQEIRFIQNLSAYVTIATFAEYKQDLDKRLDELKDSLREIFQYLRDKGISHGP